MKRETTTTIEDKPKTKLKLTTTSVGVVSSTAPAKLTTTKNKTTTTKSKTTTTKSKTTTTKEQKLYFTLVQFYPEVGSAKNYVYYFTVKGEEEREQYYNLLSALELLLEEKTSAPGYTTEQNWFIDTELFTREQLQNIMNDTTRNRLYESYIMCNKTSFEELLSLLKCDICLNKIRLQWSSAYHPLHCTCE